MDFDAGAFASLQGTTRWGLRQTVIRMIDTFQEIRQP